MHIELEPSELDLLIMLLTQRMVNDLKALGPDFTGDFHHPESPLALKLHKARNDGIMAARAAGNVAIGEKLQEPPQFGGKPGEPVSEVDPEDVKIVW